MVEVEKDTKQEDQDLDILEVVADRIRDSNRLEDNAMEKGEAADAKRDPNFAMAASLATTEVDLLLSKREKKKPYENLPANPTVQLKGSLTSSTSTSGATSNSCEVPGAYALGGSATETAAETLPHSNISRVEQTRTAPYPITSSTIEVASGGNEDDPGQTGLVVANAVDDPQDLPQAQDVQRQTGTECQGEKPKSGILLFAVGVPVLAMVVLLVVFLSNAGSGNEDDLDPLLEEFEPVPVSPFSSPTQAPTTTQEALLALLPSNCTAQVDLNNPDLPQTRAFEWLVDDQVANSLPLERIQQRFILATLFYATGGGEDLWISSQGWLDHDVHECDWFTSPDFSLRPMFSVQYPGMLAGIFPDHPNDLPQQPCNVRGLYEHLWLDQNQLEASLPEEFFLLTHLKSLSFALNRLQGTVSTRIGQLTNLEALSIMGMAQEGGSTIPSQIGLLTQAKALVLAFNDHTGTVPSELGLLSNLEHLVFGQNSKLTGSLPALSLFPDLQWIILDSCNITGTIPTQIGDLSSLEYVVLGGNSFSGTIPSQVGRLSKASMLSLTNNLLTGTIPAQLGLLSSCDLIDLDQNQLSGPIPSQFGLLKNISLFLSFGDNPFLSGSIPTQLGLLTNLYDLNFANNNHTGPIPSELGRLQSLGSLVLRNNSFTGGIPEELSSLNESMYVLDARSNPTLSGVIPPGLCRLNSTCVPFSTIKCSLHSKGEVGMSFDCNNSTLCGCGCPCKFNIL